MKPNNLGDAFTLIAEFKRGQMVPGGLINDEQIELIRLLCEDLLPTETFSAIGLGQLVEKIALADTSWNHKTQLVIDEFYVLRESGKGAEARALQKIFLHKCPSAWYRGIVESL